MTEEQSKEIKRNILVSLIAATTRKLTIDAPIKDQIGIMQMDNSMIKVLLHNCPDNIMEELFFKLGLYLRELMIVNRKIIIQDKKEESNG